MLCAVFCREEDTRGVGYDTMRVRACMLTYGYPAESQICILTFSPTLPPIHVLLLHTVQFLVACIGLFLVAVTLSPQVRWELYSKYYEFHNVSINDDTKKSLSNAMDEMTKERAKEPAGGDEREKPPGRVPVATSPPAGVGKEEDPEKKEFQMMTKDFLEKHTYNNRVIVTWANYHYLDFVKNWVYYMKKTGATNFVVGAMDPSIYNALTDMGVPTFSMDSGLSLGDFGWGSATFHKMGREKIHLVSEVTKYGIDLLLSDIDTVWLRDPNEFMDKYPDADVLTSSDNGQMTTRDGGLEFFPEAGASANIGIMNFSHRAKHVGDEWMKRLDENEKLWDQTAFNDIMRQGFDWRIPPACGSMVDKVSRFLGRRSLRADDEDGNECRREDRLFTGFDGKAKFGILPVSLFCSGHNYFVQQMPSMIDATPYVIHATFQFGGTHGKRNRFREALLWDDPPEYFTRPGGYMSFEMDIPNELLHGEFSLEAHFRLVHHQLKQIRTAFAISRDLKRALVMPKLWCLFDRYWAPLPDSGRFGSADGPPPNEPFVCPMDHVFDLNRMGQANTETKYIEWREYSFLDNERLPKEVLDEALYVGDFEHTSLEGVDASRVVTVEEPLLARDIRERFGVESEYKDKALIRFGQLEKFWLGFHEELQTERSLHKTHVEELAPFLQHWCCVRPPEGKPGHIWYDINFDEVPHKDKFNRHWENGWNLTIPYVLGESSG